MAAAIGATTRVGGDYAITALITGDNNYPAGGYPLNAGQFGMSARIDDILPLSQVPSKVVIWNQATQKLQVLVDPGTGLAEAVGGSDQSALTVQCLVFGE